MINLQRMQPWLGTFVAVRVAGDDRAELLAAMHKAFAAIAHVQQHMSYHDVQSDVGRLNRFAAQEPVQVDAMTYKVIKTALKISADSQGLFDITVAEALSAQERAAPHHVIRHNSTADWRAISLLDDCRIYFHQPLTIDLGGIAKGFAVDQAIEVLQSCAVTHGLVNAGGDMRVFGEVTEQIHIRHPQHPQHIGHALSLRNAAVATSAPTFSRHDAPQGPVSALMHPHTKRSYTHMTSVTICAPTCIIADALTKVVLLDPTRASTLLTDYQAHATVLHAEQVADSNNQWTQPAMLRTS